MAAIFIAMRSSAGALARTTLTPRWRGIEGLSIVGRVGLPSGRVHLEHLECRLQPLPPGSNHVARPLQFPRRAPRLRSWSRPRDAPGAAHPGTRQKWDFTVADLDTSHTGDTKHHAHTSHTLNRVTHVHSQCAQRPLGAAHAHRVTGRHLLPHAAQDLGRGRALRGGTDHL